jgi:hypothetical protein
VPKGNIPIKLDNRKYPDSKKGCRDISYWPTGLIRGKEVDRYLALARQRNNNATLQRKNQNCNAVVDLLDLKKQN